MKRRRIALAIFGAVVLGAALFWLSLPSVTPLRRENPATTAMIELRKEQAADAKRNYRLRWEFRPLSRISPLLSRAVVFAEDAQFWKHEGVDWEAMKDAAEHDWREKSLERGASTITQQLAKNLYLSPSRNPIRKLRELFLARRLDAELGKARVLELYLNVAEWGDGVFGAEAAARHWYGRSAAELSAVQAARLAAALPNPFKRSPKTKSRALDRKVARLVRALHRAKLIDEAAYQAALEELGLAAPLPAAPPPPPEVEEEPLDDEDGM